MSELDDFFEAEKQRYDAVRRSRTETQRGVYADLHRLRSTLVDAAEAALKKGPTAIERHHVEQGRLGLTADLDHLLDQLEQMEATIGSDLACEVASALRHIIGGAFLIGTHGVLTDEVRRRFQQQSTAAARAGRKARTADRMALARPILETAPRKPDGSLLNASKIARELANAFGVESISSNTVRKYEAARQNQAK